MDEAVDKSTPPAEGASTQHDCAAPLVAFGHHGWLLRFSSSGLPMPAQRQQVGRRRLAPTTLALSLASSAARTSARTCLL